MKINIADTEAVWASDMDVIRAARTRVARQHRVGRVMRHARHEFYRAMLNHHAAAGRMYHRVKLGA